MAVFKFQSFNFPDSFMRHKDVLGELSREVVGQGNDFSFRLVDRGRDSKGRPLVSLGAVLPARFFFRHSNFRLRLDRSAGPSDQLFRRDSTFFLEPGLAAPNEPNAVSFRSFNFPDRYVRHRDFHLFVEPKDSPSLAQDATFFKTVGID
jgi:hypothetical protein